MTDDDGILTRADWDWEAEFAPTNQTAAHRPSHYHAWQCFPLKHYEIYCNARNYEVPQEMIDKHEPVGQVILKVRHEGHLLEYSTKRPYDYDYCFELENEWKKIFSGERYGCVAGEHLGNEPSVAAGNVGSHSHWEIRQLKSKKGYWTYFARRKPGTTDNHH